MLGLLLLLLIVFMLHPVSCARLLEGRGKHANLDEPHLPNPRSEELTDVTPSSMSLELGEKLGSKSTPRVMLLGESSVHHHHHHYHRQHHKIPIPSPTSPVHVVASVQSMKQGGGGGGGGGGGALDESEEMAFHEDYAKPKTHPPHSH